LLNRTVARTLAQAFAGNVGAESAQAMLKHYFDEGYVSDPDAWGRTLQPFPDVKLGSATIRPTKCID
jgi:hypothetical protein